MSLLSNLLFAAPRMLAASACGWLDEFRRATAASQRYETLRAEVQNSSARQVFDEYYAAPATTTVARAPEGRHTHHAAPAGTHAAVS